MNDIVDSWAVDNLKMTDQLQQRSPFKIRTCSNFGGVQTSAAFKLAICLSNQTAKAWHLFNCQLFSYKECTKSNLLCNIGGQIKVQFLTVWNVTNMDGLDAF